MLGAFKAGEPVLRQISANDDLALGASLGNDLRRRLNEPLSVTEKQIYLGADPGSPRVGDLRISYKIARPEQISVIGRQSGNGFGEYQTKAGDALLMASTGNVPAADMFRAAERMNTIITWLVRGLGALGIFIGFTLIMRPLSVLGDVVPLIGSVISAGTGLIALLLTVIVAPVVIAIAWFYYRPLVSIGVLVIGAALAYGVKMLAARKSAAKAAMPVPAPAG
jgi:hypothetical protein